MVRRHLLCTVSKVCVPLIIALALGLALALCLGGCSHDSFDPIVEPEPTFSLVPRTSPENVLFDFRSIYGDADRLIKTEADTLSWSGMYGSLFHPDSFKFYFIPQDNPDPGLFPEGWWGHEPEVECFENMLRLKVRGSIDDILLSWAIGNSEPDNRTGHTGWKHIFVSGILLDIIVGSTIYRVPNGSADFYFAPDPVNPGLWVITEWYDRPIVSGSPRLHAAVEPTTWSRVKGQFRP